MSPVDNHDRSAGVLHQGQPDEERIDHALIEAATVGLFSERLGLPLLPWQQRLVDRMFIAKEAES